MNDLVPDLCIDIELDDDLPVMPQEIKLIGDLLPQLIKDLLALQNDDEM